MKDSKGDNTDEKANISKMSERAATQVGATERGCQGLYFAPKIGWNGSRTHLGQIRRFSKVSKVGVSMTRERADGFARSGGRNNRLDEPYKTC